MPKHTNPCSGVMKFTILVDPLGLIITTGIYSVCLIYAREKRRRFKKKHAFSL